MKNERPDVARVLAANLRRMMEANQIGVVDLARKAGISHSAISRYLDPDIGSDPSASTILQLAKALACTTEDLLTNKIRRTVAAG